MRNVAVRWPALVGILLPLLLSTITCGDRDAGGERTDPPNVLLITVDTLRADRLGCYGYRLPTSPQIDRLAKSGVRFSDCTVQWPKTWPSMASLLTGAYPKTTGMQYRPREMHGSLLLISEVFQKAGYTTGAVVANFNVGRRFGFDQGFETFVESWQEAWREEAGDAPFRNRPGKVKRYTNARIVTDQGLRWLRDGDRSRPFFLWLHYMDPHGPYEPPPDYARYFQGAHPPEPMPRDKLPRYQVQFDAETRSPITDLAFYRAQYDRGVRYLDDELGHLFAELDRLGFDRGSTLIVFSADHGESLDEHGYYLEHGQFSYQACARVPLIVAREGHVPAGSVIDRPVGLIDVAPTILELAGVDVPKTLEGQSLAGLIHNESGARAPEHVFMEAGYQERTQLTIRDREWKLIHVRSSADRQRMAGEAYELYNVGVDPNELDNRAAEHPDVVARLSKVLDDWYSGGPRWTERGEAVDLRALSPEEQAMLESLGYLE
jgi:arylsulfatase A-like enzyme